MNPGALNCQNCSSRFHFESRQQAQDIIYSLRSGGGASPAILREIRCYLLDKENYPFKVRGVRT